MLLTSGFVPEAHEFSGAGSPGRSRSELSPVNPEWPIATMPIGVRSPESGLIELPSVEGELLVPPQPPTTIAHRQATINGLTPRYLREAKSACRTTMQVAMLQTLKPVSENVQITGRFHATSYTSDPDGRRSSARIHRTPIPTGDKAPPAILGAQPHPQLTGRPPAVEGAIADQVDMAVLGLIHHNRSGSADSLQLVMGSCLFGHVWRAAVKAAGAPAGTGFHDLRHFYASLLIRHGESVKGGSGQARPRIGFRDARHLQPSLAGQGRPHPRSGRRRSFCGLSAD